MGLLLGMVGGVPVACGNSPSLKPFKYAWRKIGPISENRLFFGFDDWWCAWLGGRSLLLVENYTQQCFVQTPNPSNMLGAKSGLFLKSKLFFGLDDWWGFCLAWWVESL